MYQHYFGLSELPFSIAPDPRYLYLSGRHREALAHLIYGVGDQGGFVLLTGEVGTGKTTICRCLLQQMPDNADVAFIVNPRQNINQLLQSVFSELHIPFELGLSSKDLIDRLNDYLLEAHSNGRNTILIIDEAQNLSFEVLEQLRLLTNLETNDKKLLQLVLLGQPELLELLDSQKLRQLAQRVTARYHLAPLSRKDVDAYIQHRLEIAGSRESLFKPGAIGMIYRLSQGVPRVINLLCDRALLGVYANNKSQVTAGTVVQASREVFGGSPAWRRWSKSVKRWVPLGIAALIAVVVLIQVFAARSASTPELDDTGTIAGASANRVESEDAKWLDAAKNFSFTDAMQHISSGGDMPPLQCELNTMNHPSWWACQPGSVSWVALFKGPLPVALQLQNADTQTFALVVRGKTENNVVIEIAGSEYSVAADDLTPFTIVRSRIGSAIPAVVNLPIHDQDTGSGVSWLSAIVSEFLHQKPGLSFEKMGEKVDSGKLRYLNARYINVGTLSATAIYNEALQQQVEIAQQQLNLPTSVIVTRELVEKLLSELHRREAG